MGSLQESLRCGIVGAGIAGLAAAIALAKAGHDVEIFERSQFKNEVGAAIGVQPNTICILRRWGFDFATARPTNVSGVRVVDAATGKTRHFLDLEDTRGVFGEDIMSFHRVDIHAELKNLAIANGARLQLGSGVSDFDTDSGTITLRDGTVVEKDLVVVACGIHNEWVEKVAGEASPVKTMGTVYRLLAPYDQVIADPEAHELYSGGKPIITEAWSNGTLVFTYPCREASLLNIVMSKVETDKEHDIKPDEWHIDSTDEDALEIIKDCHPGFKTLVKHAQGVTRYPFSFRQPIPRMNKGRVVLIGDAAHAMMPTLGQGAGMAIEDAAALEGIFSRWKHNSKTVETMLDLFNKLRNPRAGVVQTVSNNLWRGADAVASECARFLPDGPFHPPGDHFSMPSREYLYSYDIYNEAAKISEYDRAEDIPDGLIHYFNDVTKLQASRNTEEKQTTES